MSVWLTMLLALGLDWLFKEPRHHPLLIFGRWAGWIEQRLNPQSPSTPLSDTRSIVHGAGALALAIMPAALLWWMAASLLPAWLNDAIWLYLCLGMASLLQHSVNVAEAGAHSVEQARHAVAMIVSRDTASMSEPQIAAATIESTLENGNDAVFATLFWYLVAGSGGALVHRLINTLDAMWGYRTRRFNTFGRAAAKLDDLLNWLPARLTALLYGVSGNRENAFRAWREQARTLASPNGGPTMTSGAGALNLRLGGPCRYHGEWLDKPYFGGDAEPTYNQIHATNHLLARSLWLFIGITGAGALIITGVF